MVGRNVNEIRNCSDPLQHFERPGTTSFQILDESRWKLFRSNMEHYIIPNVSLNVTPTWIGLNFILGITCLDLFTNLVMLVKNIFYFFWLVQVKNMSCKCFVCLRNSSVLRAWDIMRRSKGFVGIIMLNFKWTLAYWPIDKAIVCKLCCRESQVPIPIAVARPPDVAEGFLDFDWPL